ncbi:hypothetical protein BH23BAC4_BH23BAC4_06460 [soil metagenome]
MLLDSNLIIYAAMPEHEVLRQFIAEHAPLVSVISKIETLGYHRLQEDERQFLEAFFDASEIIAVSEQVVELSISLRQTKKMSLGDALIGATAICYDIPLLTRNVADFHGIGGLKVIDPFTTA